MYQGGNEGSRAPHALHCIRLAHLFSVSLDMNNWLRRHGVSLALIALAMICYSVGYRKGSALALILGVLFELGFWMRFWRRD